MRTRITLSAIALVALVACVNGDPFNLDESCPVFELNLDTILAHEHPDSTENDLTTTPDPWNCPGSWAVINRVVQRRDSTRRRFKGHRRRMATGWRPWGIDGRIGFSFNVGNVRAELFPKRDPADGLTKWYAVVWLGDDRANPIDEFGGGLCDTHWEVGDAVAEAYA